MSPNIQSVSPTTPSSAFIRCAAPVGTARIIPPSAEREASSQVYAKPRQSTSIPTSTAAKERPAALGTDKKHSGGKNKKKGRKVSLDFSVLAPSDEELFDGNGEAPPDVDTATKEEILGCEYDSDEGRK